MSIARARRMTCLGGHAEIAVAQPFEPAAFHPAFARGIADRHRRIAQDDILEMR
ncbi:hypothetical protein ACFSTD_03310 [Novosphingobium colocasiae]